jgi:hypothetical protein
MKNAIKHVLHFCLQFLLEILFTVINIHQVILWVCAGINVGLHIKCPLFLADFNQNWNVLTHFRGTPNYQLSQKSV